MLKMKLELKKTIKESYTVAKNNKWLWIYGILATASQSSYNISRNLSSQDLQNLPRSMPSSLGALESIFTSWTSQLTFPQISLFFGSIATFAVFSIIIGFIISSWAEAAIIFGSKEAQEKKEVNLTNTSPTGLSKLKDMIIFRLIDAAMALVVVLAVLIPSVIIITILVSFKITIAAVIFGIIAAVIFLWAMVALTGAAFYGYRAIVLKNYTPWNAWKTGFKMGKRYVIETVITSAISGIVAGLFSFLVVLVSLFVLGLPAFFILAPIIEGTTQFALVKVLPLPLIVLSFIWISVAVTGATNTFKVSFWNQVFEKLWKEK